jgi:hypothetical protein
MEVLSVIEMGTTEAPAHSGWGFRLSAIRLGEILKIPRGTDHTRIHVRLNPLTAHRSGQGFQVGGRNPKAG